MERKRIKPGRRVAVGSAMIVFIAALMAGAGAEALDIKFLIGNVSVTRNGKALAPELNTRLLTGDLVVTGNGGIAVLAYKDGSEVKVLENSRVRIGSVAVPGSDDVSVISGNINAKFRKLAKGSERKVYTPTTVCSVRGTDFLVGVSDTADSRVDLSEGKLAVRNPYGAIKLEENQKTDIGLGEAPEKTDDAAGINDWKAAKDGELRKDPEGRGKKYQSYFNTLQKRNGSASGDLDGINKKLAKPGDKKELEKTGSDLDRLRQSVEEDMFLCEAAGSSIDGVLSRFKKDRDDIYNTFLTVKEESNKVLEQQRKNYEALEAVRQAYKKAYDEIMKGHEERIKKIKGGIDRESVRPEIKKK